MQFRLCTSINEEDLRFNFGASTAYNSRKLNAFDSTVPTVMYMHGYLGNVSTARQYCDALGMKYEGNVNCIIVDWISVAHHFNYIHVKESLGKVSDKLEFSFYLKDFFIANLLYFPDFRRSVQFYQSFS